MSFSLFVSFIFSIHNHKCGKIFLMIFLQKSMRFFWIYLHDFSIVICLINHKSRVVGFYFLCY